MHAHGDEKREGNEINEVPGRNLKLGGVRCWREARVGIHTVSSYFSQAKDHVAAMWPSGEDAQITLDAEQMVCAAWDDEDTGWPPRDAPNWADYFEVA